MSQYNDPRKGKSSTGDPNKGKYSSGNNNKQNRNKKNKEYDDSNDMEPSLAPSLSLLASHKPPQYSM